MAEREYVTRALKPDENTTLAKLSLPDMIRLLFSKISNRDEAELDANTRLSVSYLKNIASLNKFIDKATERLTAGNEESVTILLSSEYLPYIDEVIDPIRGKGKYFDFDVRKKNLPQNVKHRFVVVIRKKTGLTVD